MNDENVKKELQKWEVWLDENNAGDIDTECIADISDLCDYVITATVNNSRHMAHLSESAMSFAKSLDASLINADGLDSREWVVLDFGIYMIHLFLPDTREKYNLVDLWKDIKKEKSQEE
jgi:ribosome-associated protein